MSIAFLAPIAFLAQKHTKNVISAKRWLLGNWEQYPSITLVSLYALELMPSPPERHEVHFRFLRQKCKAPAAKTLRTVSFHLPCLPCHCGANGSTNIVTNCIVNDATMPTAPPTAPEMLSPMASSTTPQLQQRHGQCSGYGARDIDSTFAHDFFEKKLTVLQGHVVFPRAS